MTPETPLGFRAGLAVLVGRTNAGKSTLLNALVGAKVSIVTPKPQTTRQPLQGVVHRPEGQVAFVDTPGFFKTHASRLVERLHERARQALRDIDVVVHVADPTRPIGPEDRMVRKALAGVTQPRLLCLSKADVPERPARDRWLALAADYAEVIEVSALAGTGLDRLLAAAIARLPEGPPLYPPDELTNAHRSFQIAELIREQVYLRTDDEVPYRTDVEVGTVEEVRDARGRTGLRVLASVLAANERYQRMLIGVGAQKIRGIRHAARAELRRRFGCPVDLELDVVVEPGLLK